MVGEVENPVFLSYSVEDRWCFLQGGVGEMRQRRPNQVIGLGGFREIRQVLEVVITTTGDQVVIFQPQVILQE